MCKCMHAKQPCQAHPPNKKSLNGAKTLHTSSQLLQHLACQVSAFVKLPWLSCQGWHHAFAAKLRCYCSHAHCLDEAQTLCAFGILSKQYACQVSAPKKLPCLAPTIMMSDRAKASSSPTRCPKHSLAGPESRHSILKAASLPSCSPNHASKQMGSTSVRDPHSCRYP